MAEYGDPDTDDWEYLQKYSPYHSKLSCGRSFCFAPCTSDARLFTLSDIDPSKAYPPILVTTSTRDDRVHPAHARKFVKVSSSTGSRLENRHANHSLLLTTLFPLSQKLQDFGIENVQYYENIEGGHGGAADAKQTAFMTALAYDFMFEELTNNAIEM